MKTLLILSAAACTVLMFARADVRAAPIAPSVDAAPGVTLVAQGCGRGFHRGRFGRCARNLSPAYPCFWRRGPYGRWHLICR